jgi:hypothetical protein
MGILRGIETLGLGKTESKEIFYAGAGAFEDADGDEVKVLDVICLECRNSYYVLKNDPIDFCPHCGDRRGKVWADYDKARTWAMEHQFDWLRERGRAPIGVRTSRGVWVLGLARSAADLLRMDRTGTIVQARELLIDDRQVANVDGGSGFGGGSSADQKAPGAFGGGGDEWGGGLEID